MPDINKSVLQWSTDLEMTPTEVDEINRKRLNLLLCGAFVDDRGRIKEQDNGEKFNPISPYWICRFPKVRDGHIGSCGHVSVNEGDQRSHAATHGPQK